MDRRFESDMAEISGDGNYLMICSERKTIFLDGSVTGKIPLADVSSISADEGSIVVHLVGGETRVCSFPTETASEIEQVAAQLSECIANWR